MKASLEPLAKQVWLTLLGLGGLWELRGLIDPGRGDTFSELMVRSMADRPLLHGAVAGFWLWLTLHLRIYGDPTQGMALTSVTWAAVFTVAGMVVVGVIR